MTTDKAHTHAINPLKIFLAGGFGGICSVVVGHPFDTIKVRLQTMPHVGPGETPLYLGTWDCVKKTVASDGVLGLYKGMGAPIVGVSPISAICFFGYNWGRRLFASDPSHLAGPVDVVRQLHHEGGIRGLYRGTVATLLRDVPATGACFLSYEWIKEILRNWSGSGDQLNVSNTLLAGGLAGMCTWMVAIPADVLKSRYQTAPDGRYPNGVRSVLSGLLAEEGFFALYRGVTPIVLRAFPANAACFLGYEATVKFFDFVQPNW